MTRLTKRKAKRQQAALQNVIDISERLGLYDAETEELDRLLARRRRKPGARVRPSEIDGPQTSETPDAA